MRKAFLATHLRLERASGTHRAGSLSVAKELHHLLGDNLKDEEPGEGAAETARDLPRPPEISRFPEISGDFPRLPETARDFPQDHTTRHYTRPPGSLKDEERGR